MAKSFAPSGGWDGIVVGGKRLGVGYHRVQITDLRDDVRSNSGKDGWEFTFSNGEGSIRDTLWLTDEAAWRVKMLAIACGIPVEGRKPINAQQFMNRKLTICCVYDQFTAKDGSVKDSSQIDTFGFHPANYEVPEGGPVGNDRKPAQKPALETIPSSNGDGGKVLKDYGLDDEIPF